MKPTIGRIVHFTVAEHNMDAFKGGTTNVRVGTVVPAIVVTVWSDTCVNLKVLADGDKDAWITSVTQAPNDQVNVPGNWNWPPREN